MSLDIEKWFTDSEAGHDWQDFDLVLAKPALLPRLQSYLADSNGSDEKKETVISALVELLSEIRRNPSGEDMEKIAGEVKAIIRRHSDIAEQAIPELGLVQGITVQKLLGLPVPFGFPQWALDAADDNCS
jgi:hypothetical protein